MSLPSPDPRPTNVRWMIVGLLMGVVFLAHFNRLGISVAGNETFIGEGKLTEEQMGRVYSAFLLVYTIGMLPGGWLIDRIGPRMALTGMGLGLGFCAALTGVLGWAGLTITAMYLPLLAVRGLAGASSVPLHPAAARSVSLWLPLSERSTANGLVNAGALVGIAVTYPLFGLLMDRLDWPGAFVTAGAALMLFALLWFALSADTPAVHPRANDAERRLAAGVPARASIMLGDFLGLFRNRGLVLLALSYGMLGYVQYMFFYWIEYYFNKQLHLSPAASREAAFVATMASAVGMACGGWVSDRLCRALGHVWGCRVMAILGMGLSAGFALMGVSTSDAQEVEWYFSLSLGSLGLCEGIFWTTAPTLEKRSGGLAAAFLNTGGNGFGILAPVVTPWIGRYYGWTTAVAVACALCGVGALLWFGIRSGAADESRTDLR